MDGNIREPLNAKPLNTDLTPLLQLPPTPPHYLWINPFNTALTSRVHMSGVEANYIVNQSVKEAEDKDGAKNPQTKD